MSAIASPTETMCYVKQKAMKLVRKPRRVFVDFEPGQAPIVQGVRGPHFSPFLRVEVREGECYPCSVALCLLFDGVVTSYNIGKSKTVALRNLRCSGKPSSAREAGSDFLHLLWCAKCGVCLYYTREWLDTERPEMCEFCKAPVSTRACPTFHSFGYCTECSLDELTPCPFAALDPTCQVDPAFGPV